MKNIITISILLLLSFNTNAQQFNSTKIEVGVMDYRYGLVKYDPGFDWKGYNLENNQNGLCFNAIHGLNFLNKRLFVGIGLGYLNYEGINGISLFTDFEYLPLKTKLSPLLNLKLGYDHIWNQYAAGTGTMHTELNLGLNIRLSEKYRVYMKSGLLSTQQAFLIPVTLGFGF